MAETKMKKNNNSDPICSYSLVRVVLIIHRMDAVMQHRRMLVPEKQKQYQETV
jgi:hypothetical protein